MENSYMDVSSITSRTEMETHRERTASFKQELDGCVAVMMIYKI